jgi:hypothetical protein
MTREEIRRALGKRIRLLALGGLRHMRGRAPAKITLTDSQLSLMSLPASSSYGVFSRKARPQWSGPKNWTVA